MSDAYAAPDSVPFSDSPDANSAASDLRAAAEGKMTSRVSVSSPEKASALKEAAVQKAAQIRDFAGEKAQSLKTAASEKIGEKATHFKGAASESWQDSREKAREVHASLEDYIRENPTKAALSAVGIGFVLGLLIRR